MKRFVLTISLALLVGCAGPTEESTPETDVPAPDAEAAAPVAPDTGDTAELVDYCSAQANLTPICGFGGAPEDAEWLPDGSGLIVSEMPGFVEDATEGRISLVNVETGEITLLHDASMQNPETDENVWGAEGVTSKQVFSPHGINLSQRSDGRWQLLVVNHAETETIDFFELLQVDGQWALQWRGGVDAEGTDIHNDLDAAGTGLYVTRYFKGDLQNLFVDYTQQLENGIVKKWTPEEGWTELEGTKGVSLNGILWNEAEDELLVSEWGRSKVNVFTGEGVKKYAIEDVSHPDNISWNGAGDAYLVASKKAGLEKIAACGAAKAEVCEGEFNIFEIEPGSGLKTTRFNSDGTFWGPPSNAVEKDGKLYIGSFGGTRLLIVE